MENEIKTPAVVKTMMDIEFHPELSHIEINPARDFSMSLADLSVSGAVLSQIPQLINSVTSAMGDSGAAGLYRCVMPEGVEGTLAGFINRAGISGNIVDANKNLIARAAFVEADGVGAAAASTVAPELIAAAAIVMAVNSKLNAIQKQQEEILDFLNREKEAQIEADIRALSEIMSGYKFNWDRDTFKTSQHTIVSQIKGRAEQSIISYQKQMSSYIKGRKNIHFDNDAGKFVHRMSKSFKQYQLCVYLFAFSSFLDPILLENYKPEYLHSLKDRIDDYSIQYRTDYTNCYDVIKKYVDSAAEKAVLGATADAVGIVGKAVKKVPLAKKVSADKLLKSAESKIDNSVEKRTDELMQSFEVNKDVKTSIFKEFIDRIDRLYNSPVDLMFDKDNVYIIALSPDAVK